MKKIILVLSLLIVGLVSLSAEAVRLPDDKYGKVYYSTIYKKEFHVEKRANPAYALLTSIQEYYEVNHGKQYFNYDMEYLDDTDDVATIFKECALNDGENYVYMLGCPEYFQVYYAYIDNGLTVQVIIGNGEGK